jgi:D-lactate dehydrogenase
MLSGSYTTLHARLASSFPPARLIHDDLRTLAYGTDASFYRLIPKVVVKVRTEEEVATLLRETSALKTPVTFRAAGTSLSGQALSDSVLAMLDGWTRYRISEDASQITLQPGIIGGHANIFLAPFERKIGPDPASINAAMIGGIVANNSSGMCCGTAQNSYRTLVSMRIIFRDGTLLDTGNRNSRERFASTHSTMLARLSELGRRVRSTSALAERIRRKYAMKNTTGYSLNALVDFDDPFEILQHLMVGSEGTLGFIAEVTLRTVPDLPHKASALMLFPDIEAACTAATILKTGKVEAVELMDRPSLRSVQEKRGMPDYLKALDDRAASLLVETRATGPDLLAGQIREITHALDELHKLRPIEFTSVPSEFTRLWDIRKGLFPAVGAMRRTGTSVIIEDVAFPMPSLAAATLELQRLMATHGYPDGIIFGHALEGNLHFTFTQNFNTTAEVDRYKRFMDDVAEMVVHTYDGSLKAEHGTGRNMAPFVEMEWGSEAYALMKEIKDIFDPEYLLNPGVILNSDPLAHVKDLKPLPPAHEIVDKCIECGFCEVQCPSLRLTLSPRQRIVAYREMARLRETGENPSRLRSLQRSFHYLADDTCATDGLCALTCPVGINTGTLIKELRAQKSTTLSNALAWMIARNMGAATAAIRLVLNLANTLHGFIGTESMRNMTAFARRFSSNKFPQWNEHMPMGGRRVKPDHAVVSNAHKVVYFPSCINRAMGPSRKAPEQVSVVETTVSLLKKGGYEVIHPSAVNNLCCGMAFASKGFTSQAQAKAKELRDALMKSSEGGRYPVLFDMSPCTLQMMESLNGEMKVYEPVEFILGFLVDRLEFRKLPDAIAIHTVCSAKKMGLDASFLKLARLCAENVVVPHGIGCCGWAGDRGFTFPELNASALEGLAEKIPDNCHRGYSTSRTCEIGLSLHSGIPYESVVYLVDRCTGGK